MPFESVSWDSQLTELEDELVTQAVGGEENLVVAVYLDRGFYDSKCLTLLQAHNHAYVMPIVRWGTTIKQELSKGWSRVIQHDLTGKLDGHSWTVEFPVYID